METIRLKLGNNNSEFFKWATVIDCGDFDSDEMPTTLKDIATIVWSLCGCGVMDLLATELSKELNTSPEETLSCLEKIIEKYYKMDEEEAYELCFSNSIV